MNHKTQNALKFMLVFSWKHKRAYLFLLGIEQMLYLLFGLVNIVFPGLILEALFETGRIAGFFQIILLYCGLHLSLKSLAQYVRTHIYGCVYELSMRFSMYVGRVTTELDFQYLEDEKVMNLHDRAIGCVYQGGFFGPLEQMFSLSREMLMIISSMSILFHLNGFLVMICLAVVGLNFVVNHKVNRKIYELEASKTKIERKKNYILSVFDDFNYGKEIRVNGLISILKDRLSGSLHEVFRVNKKIHSIQAQNRSLEGTTSVIQQTSVYILLALEVVRQGLNIGDFTLYFNAVNQFSGSIQSLLKGYLSLSKMGLYIGDLEAFVSLPRMDDLNAKEEVNTEKEFCIEFIDVSFRYPGSDTYALQHINLKITQGDRLAIVGANGAGKTTLIKLMLRLYTPEEGRILLNGRDIRQFRYEEYAKVFSVVFQDYKLFAFSIRENICLSECCDEDKMKDAIDKSGLSEKISRLPGREETLLFKAYDDSGVELSGGEAQKLGIARALYKDARVVILDEPTAALDPVAEHEIYQRFDALVQGKSSIYISHRLASTRFANHILVLDRGSIVEQGKHADLIRENGLYAEMYRMQVEYYDTSQEGMAYE